MYLTGFADEATKTIEEQIRVTRQLGWRNIETRHINDKYVYQLSDEEFDHVCDQLHREGVSINCQGSGVANWGKQIDEPFDSSLEEARILIPRMQRLGTKLIRIMSFAVMEGRSPEDQMKELRFERLRELTKMFGDAGITVVHENCMNFGGMGWTYTLELIENVPGLKLVFDTGNPVFTHDRTKPTPYPQQSAWEFYQNVKQHIEYVHIKDGIWNGEEEKVTYTFPGEGEGDVKRIVRDLLDNGYDGGFSMEPHMAVVLHDSTVQTEQQVAKDNYVEYGRCFEKLITEIGHGDKLN